MSQFLYAGMNFFKSRVIEGTTKRNDHFHTQGMDRADEFVVKNIATLNKNCLKRSIRVMTWNIFYGKRLAEIISLIRNHDPDIICLQEVDERSINQLTRSLSMSGVYCREFLDIGGSQKGLQTGNLILSKFRLENPVHIHLPTIIDWQQQPSEPRVGCRNAVGASFTFNGKKTTVFSTHLEVYAWPYERVRQMQHILTHCPKNTAIIAGDFNTFFPITETVHLCVKKEKYLFKKVRRTTNYILVNDIDKIYSRLPIMDYYTIPVDDSISDHYPVIAELGTHPL